MLSTLPPDLRHAARSLARSPGFTIAALAMLALGIGANVTVYSVLRGVLLKPLGYSAESGLLHITGAKPRDNARDLVVSVPVVAGAALLAGYLPARGATKVDPLTALRCE